MLFIRHLVVSKYCYCSNLLHFVGWKKKDYQKNWLVPSALLIGSEYTLQAAKKAKFLR